MKSIAIAALAATVSAAAIQRRMDSPFQIMSLRSGSDIHFAPVSAAASSLWLKLDQQNATCDTADNSATFRLFDGDNKLYLYSTKEPAQVVYVDRGMGQGKVGYITGNQSLPAQGETTGWVIDEAGDITLDGAGFLACPETADGSGAWSIWVSTGTATPGGNHANCVGFSARTVTSSQPDSCQYTQ